MQYDAVIIGAGSAGLACALKLASLRKKILLLERQSVPGGLATTFKRGGFTFEASIHCVDALCKGQDIRIFLDRFGIAKGIEFVELKDFCRTIYPEHDFVLDFKRDNFIDFLKLNFPKERKNIDRLFCSFDKFYQEFDNFYALGVPFWLKLILSPFIYSSIIKASLLSIEQFISRYAQDKKLKAMITDICRFSGLPPSRLCALYFLLVFRGYYYQSTCYIKGSFSKLFEAMVEKIKKVGGEVRFNTSVKQIITEKGKSVKAVVTDKGEEIKTKTIISNANAIDTLTKLIDEESVRQKYSKILSSLEKSISAFQVYLGLRVPAKNLGMNHFMFFINTTYNHEDSFNHALLGDYENCSLSLVDHSQIDSNLVPEGKGSLLIMTLDNYKNWQNLTDEEYREKKMEIANKLISQAEKYLPGLAKNIEVMEVASPRTILRFGSVPEGAIYGFAQGIKQSGMKRLAQKTKVKGLFLAGAWTRPGAGIHGCFISGIDAADLTLRFLQKCA